MKTDDWVKLQVGEGDDEIRLTEPRHVGPNSEFVACPFCGDEFATPPGIAATVTHIGGHRCAPQKS